MVQRVVYVLKSKQFLNVVRNYVFLTLGTVCVIFSFDVFSRVTNIAPGGVGGLSLIVNHFTGWPLGVITLLIQAPLLVIGFYFLGRFHFLVSAWYVTLLYSFGLDLVATLIPHNGLTDDLLLNTLYGGVIGGIGGGLIFAGRGAFVGTGIVSRIIQLKSGLPITQIYLLVDGGVIFVQGLLFGWEIALYALLMLFVWGLATDYTLEGPSVIRTVFIVTTHAEEISTALFERLGVGITAWQSEGMYSHTQKTTLFCTVYRPDIALLKEVIAQVDPHAFVVIGQGQQTRGGVLRHKRLKEVQEKAKRRTKSSLSS